MKKKVPTLCDDPNLAPYGACRVCSVEVALEKDGPTRVVASCHTPVAENQHIFTSNEALTSLRKKYCWISFNWPSNGMWYLWGKQ